jgi:hypothetical protein
MSIAAGVADYAWQTAYFGLHASFPYVGAVLIIWTSSGSTTD